MKVLQALNTLVLFAILATLVAILLHIRSPLKVEEPVAIQGWSPLRVSLNGPISIPVAIDDQPVKVTITR